MARLSGQNTRLIFRVQQKSNPLRFFKQFSQQLLGISKENFTNKFNYSVGTYKCLITREWTILARTDTIRYKYSSVNNS